MPNYNATIIIKELVVSGVDQDDAHGATQDLLLEALPTHVVSSIELEPIARDWRQEIIDGQR
ncbi:hypothetical protein LCGC14_3115080 [marine sediment metagenome]|uniref:Uncharacterized protein n=1 Tax=marine sediment metagenome TaxID=412755 RepID=A0A0F8YTW9_9ZZZZ